MKLQLPSDISSHQDLKGVVTEIRAYGRWAAHSLIKKHVTPHAESEPPVISEAATDLIKQWQAAQKTDQNNLDELTIALEDYAAMAPKINITLAAVPSSGLKRTLVAWCRKNIDPRILVDFRFNSTMLGGMAVAYGSRVYDWSFKRRIIEAKDKFPEVLRNV